MRVTGQIWKFLQSRVDSGSTLIGLRGPRRASKTWTIGQFLLHRMYEYGEDVIFASMTEAQGDLGVYRDCKQIISSRPLWQAAFDISRSPRAVECKALRDGKNGYAVFRSFRDPETAKGAACDWVFMNEANKFSLQQYYDLSANARKGVLIDFNPNARFWAGEVLQPEDELRVDWRWNKPNLTAAQLKWFADVTARGLAPDATAMDKYFYAVYVLGEYAEMEGAIFTRSNISREEVKLQGLTNYFIYADPSSMCGADYFASVLCAARDGVLYIVEVDSRNVGSKAQVAEVWQRWCEQYDVHNIFVEGNGLVGKQVYEEQRSTFPNMLPYANRDSKHGRIIGNYEELTTRVVFNNACPQMDEFLQQVYAYEGKDSSKTHDDNIDAVNSAYEIAHRRLRVV